MSRFIGGLLLALTASVATSAPAAAHGHVFIGVGFPLFWPSYYYAPAPVYYAPPPYYYGPGYYGPSYYAPSYYSPRPVYYTPPAAVAPPTCRKFDGDAVNDDSSELFYGTACLQSDGKWHIVN